MNWIRQASSSVESDNWEIFSRFSPFQGREAKTHKSYFLIHGIIFVTYFATGLVLFKRNLCFISVYEIDTPKRGMKNQMKRKRFKNFDQPYSCIIFNCLWKRGLENHQIWLQSLNVERKRLQMWCNWKFSIHFLYNVWVLIAEDIQTDISYAYVTVI